MGATADTRAAIRGELASRHPVYGAPGTQVAIVDPRSAFYGYVGTVTADGYGIRVAELDRNGYPTGRNYPGMSGFDPAFIIPA